MMKRGARQKGRWYATGLFALLALLSPRAVSALQDMQQMLQQRGGQREPIVKPEDENRLKPVVDRDAHRWLARAREAAEREDWKLAADTLNRVIDEYGDRTVSSDDEQLYYSAAKVAREAFMRLPPEGLQTYRVLYDAEAQALYDAAKQSHDLDRLRLLAQKYPMTTVAPAALDLLANWLLDRGRGGEALEVLTQLDELPHSKVPRWRILARMAVAYALVDQHTRATETIEQLRALSERSDAAFPPDGADRLKQIAAFVERQKERSDSPSAELGLRVWPALLGPAHTAGWMQPTNPAVTPEEFWRDTLPGTERIDLPQVDALIASTGRSPVWQCISDGRSLFVSTPEGIVARDLATFDLIWRSVPRARPRDLSLTQFRASTGIVESDNRDRLDELTATTLFHEYRGMISCGHGLVFMIEQLGTAGERYPTRQGTVDPNDSYGISGSGEPNSLRAFEADTGRAAWTRGRGGSPDDELRHVHFYSPPVVCGPNLLTVFQAGSDLNLAVLSPDGKLVRKILLGSARPGLFPMNGVLQPTVYDGTIYVPTGAGMLIALSEFDYSLRWLSNYKRTEFSRRGSSGREVVWGGRSRVAPQLDEWLSAPPLMVAGLVVLAPHDSGHLMAFDRRTGELRWSRPRGTWRYPVGANNRSIYVAGHTVTRLDADTGEVRWHTEDFRPTGRPALSGDKLFIPTLNGLWQLDAETGTPIGYLMPTSQAMGNLLAIDGAMYSVTATSISKFPDVQQSRQMAFQALERDPADLSATLRLAWLAAIERKWNDTLELLDRSEQLLSDQPNPELTSRISHQRVQVLLSLAAESAPETRQEILERAAQSARRPDDRIRTALALAELLAEQKNFVDAYLRSASLLREWGDQPTALEASLDARASVLICERLNSIWQRASTADRNLVVERLRPIVTQDLADLDYDKMSRLSDGLVSASASSSDLSGTRAQVGGAVQSAELKTPADSLLELAAGIDVRLGTWCAEQGDPESAVFYWERAARRAVASEAGRDALMQLALLYAAEQGVWPAAPAEAVRVRQLFEANHADATLPASLRRMVRAGSANAAAEPESAQTFLAYLDTLLPARALSDKPIRPRMLNDLRRLQLVGQDEIPSSMQLRDTVSFFDSIAAPDIFAGVLPILKLSQIIGVRAQSRSSDLAIWTNDLGPVIEDQEAVLREWGKLNVRPAAISGRIAVLASGGRVTSIGLLTGRMMWPSTFIESDGGALPEPPLVHVDGIVIVATHANTLVALPARQGARPIWRRKFSGRPIGKLAVVHGQLVAIDAAAEKLSLLDPASGRVRRQFELLVPTAMTQKESQVQQALKEIVRVARGASGPEDTSTETSDVVEANVAIAGRTVCRAGYSRVVGRDIETGRTIWEIPTNGLINGMLELSDRYIGVCHGRNRLTVVEAATGTVVQEIHAKGLQLPPLDAVVDPPPPNRAASGERLILFAQTVADPPQYLLACYPLKEGEQGWRQELGPLATVSRRMLRASPDYVAAVVYEFRADNQMMAQRPMWARSVPNIALARLFIFDKSDRRRLIESPYNFEMTRQDDRAYSGLISDVAIFDERVIAVGPDGYYVLQASEEQSAKHHPAGASREDERLLLRRNRGEP